MIPAAQALADAAVARVQQTTAEVDTLLSRLAYSCRKGDPELSQELRGELLFMARVIEEPVSEEGGWRG
jgi:hypothetical protein